MKITFTLKSLLGKIIKHKFVSAIVAVVLAAGGYFAFNSLGGSASQARYVLAAAEKGQLITAVSGSGQVSASKQVDIKATVSGDVLSVNAKVGDEVKKGKLIAQLDSTTAQKSVRDAEISLESANLALERLQEPATDLAIFQAENSLILARQTEQQAQDNLEKSYQDGLAAVETIFTTFPNVMIRLHDIVIGQNIQSNNINYYIGIGDDYDSDMSQYGNRVSVSYQKAAEEYEKNFNDYLITSRSSDSEAIKALASETAVTVNDVSEAIKNASDLISHAYDVIPATQGKTISDAKLTSLNSDAAVVKTYLANITTAKNSIRTYELALTSASNSIVEKTAALDDLKAGPDELDLHSQQISISQREDALADAKEKLNDYSIRAPFDGVIAALTVSQGDSIASISSYGTIATIITKNRVAEVSLNEVDASNVKTGQKAILSFDAIDGLTIAGEVSEIDTIGTVSQGVVSYNVKIVFDSDDRVKPGMSVSASIITDVKQDILLVPSAAIKGTEGAYYVEILSASSLSGQNATGSEGVISVSAPIQQTIETGSSDDTMVEVTNGIKEGDLVVVKTVVTAAKASSSQGQGLFSMPGNNRNSSTKSSSGSSSSGNSSTKTNSSGGGGEMTPPPGM
jgi:HlyD family secretion protein